MSLHFNRRKTPYGGLTNIQNGNNAPTPERKSTPSANTSTRHTPTERGARARYNAAVRAFDQAADAYRPHKNMLKAGGHPTLTGKAAYEAWQQAYQEMRAAELKLSKVEDRR